MAVQASRSGEQAGWSLADRQAFQAARQALARGDLPGAERGALALARMHPGSADIHHLVATTRRRRGDPGGAARAYAAAEAAAPDNVDLLLDFAGLLDSLDAWDQAVWRYRRVLALVPDHPAALLGLALALKHAGQLDAALDVATQATRHVPQDARLWQIRGAILRDLGEPGAAAAAFAHTLRLAPLAAGALRGLACAEEEAGRPAAALFSSALDRLPGDRQLHIALAVAEAAEGRAGPAIDRLAALAAAAPEWVEAQEALARLRWQHAGPDGFDEGFRIATAAAPHCALLWVTWLRALARAGRHERVTEVAWQARTMVGPSIALDLVEAGSASQAGEIDRADLLFGAIPPETPQAIPQRLMHLLRAGRPGEVAAFSEGLLPGPLGTMAAPFLDAAWRLLDDARAEWLSGQPALIGTAIIDIDLDALAARLRVLHGTRHAPLDQSLRGGTQTEGPLLSREEPIWRQLRHAVIDAAERYAANLPDDRAHPFLRARSNRLRVSGSWSVRLTAGGFHVAHVHSAGWISSAFYAALPVLPEDPADQAGWLTLGQPPVDLAPTLSPRRVIRPQTGLLVIFPSLMWHATKPFAAGERLTAAFDFVPRG